MQTQGKVYLVRRQYKDQVWYEVIKIITMEQIHEIPKNTESCASSISLSSKENSRYIRRNIP